MQMNGSKTDTETLWKEGLPEAFFFGVVDGQ